MATPDLIPPISPEMPPPPREDVPTREPEVPNGPDTPELPPDQEDVPTDVLGSGADISRSGADAEERSPRDKLRRGNGQMDDNIDDLGHKPDGTALDQPGVEGVSDDDK